MNERLYEPTDLPSVMETYTVSIRTLAVSFYSSEQIEAWAPAVPDPVRWQERLGRLHTVVADSGGTLAGFASYTPAGYLDSSSPIPPSPVKVWPAAFTSALSPRCVLGSAPQVTTHASLAAHSFFERHGFRLDGEEDVACRGTYLRRFAMHKPLHDSRYA